MMQICLVGCGGMAAHYRHRYTQIPGARLACVVDAHAETAERAAKELGVERFSTDFRDALREDIHIVDISTPNHLHAEQAVAAMRAGKHVLLQKPIAPHVEEAAAIIAAARETGRQAGVYMSMRDNPVYHDIKQMIREGRFGAVSAVHCRGAHTGGLSLQPGSWRNSKDKTGGGSFIQLASHHIHILQWLLDSPIVRVAAFSTNLMCPNLEGDDSTAAICQFADGTLGTLESSYCTEAKWLLAVYGSHGFVRVTDDFQVELKLDRPFAGEHIRYASAGRVATLPTELSFDSLKSGRNPHDQHIAFVEAMLAGKPAPVPAETALYDLQVVKAVYRAAEERRFVDVGEISSVMNTI